jgi:DNA-binding winged helix-turn-helix (wHTH) protein/tetratricopeptide (TPR) repeat protein
VYPCTFSWEGGATLVGTRVNAVSSSAARVLRFGVFEVDLQTGELRRHGLRVRLPSQSFQVLALLLEHPGELVTREEFREKLWHTDTFVDFDHGVHAAVNRLREALGDSADCPKFVETLPRRGYRFIVPVEWNSVDSEQAAPVSSGVAPTQRSWPRYVLGIASLILVALALTVPFLYKEKPRALGETDTVILADFSNKTGDPAFDDALQQALSISLQQSPFLNVLSDHKVRETLKLMGRPVNENLGGEAALVVCQRTGSKAVFSGSITKLGNQYVIGLDARNCETGEVIAVEQLQAPRKEAVLDTLGSAGKRLRRKLGESLSSLQKFEMPLEKATTSSIAALKAYGAGKKIGETKGEAESIPYFKHAIDLDPNFALAYASLSGAYQNLGEGGISRGYAQKAFALRDRVTERENFGVQALYFNFVTGEREKAIENCTLWAQSYPRELTAHICLFFTREYLGRNEESLADGLECIRLEPDNGTCYGELVSVYGKLNRLSEAKMIYQQGLSRRLDHPFLHGSRYFIAFLEDDPEEMERQVNWAAGKTGTEDSLLADQSDTEAFFGRFAKARNLSRRVVESAVRHGQTDLVGQWQINGALREALVGNNGRARQQASLALSRASTQVSREVAGVVFAMTGDSVRAKGLGQELTRSFPYDTMQINFWRPITLAAVQMSSNSPARALDELRAAAPYEMGEQLPLLAAYLRGQAYLALHRGPEAAVEFQKLIDHRGLVGNRVYASLARLGAARSFWMESDTVKARAAYNDFFKLWRNADPDIPVLIAARAEYAKLK